MNNEFNELKERIFNIFQKEIVNENCEEISMYDLVNKLKENLDYYTEVLIKDNESFVKKINRNTLFKKNIPYILKIVPTINEENDVFLKVFLKNYDEKKLRQIDVLKNTNNKLLSFRFNDRENNTHNVLYLDKFKDKLNFYLDTLIEFNNKYDGIKYTFDKDNKDIDNNYIYEDNFIKCSINFNDLDKTTVVLNDYKDLAAATYKQKSGEVLHDYIDFYNDEIMKKTSINKKDLNDLSKKILNYNKNNKLELK